MNPLSLDREWLKDNARQMMGLSQQYFYQQTLFALQLAQLPRAHHLMKFQQGFPPQLLLALHT
jgi:hypothetical protein